MVVVNGVDEGNDTSLLHRRSQGQVWGISYLLPSGGQVFGHEEVVLCRSDLPEGVRWQSLIMAYSTGL